MENNQAYKNFQRVVGWAAIISTLIVLPIIIGWKIEIEQYKAKHKQTVEQYEESTTTP